MKVKLRQSALPLALEKAKKQAENFRRQFTRAGVACLASELVGRPPFLADLILAAGMNAAWDRAHKLVVKIEEASVKTEGEPPDTIVELELDFGLDPGYYPSGLELLS